MNSVTILMTSHTTEGSNLAVKQMNPRVPANCAVWTPPSIRIADPFLALPARRSHADADAASRFARSGGMVEGSDVIRVVTEFMVGGQLGSSGMMEERTCCLSGSTALLPSYLSGLLPCSTAC
jgi:hypothetical protein